MTHALKIAALAAGAALVAMGTAHGQTSAPNNVDAPQRQATDDQRPAGDRNAGEQQANGNVQGDRGDQVTRYPRIIMAQPGGGTQLMREATRSQQQIENAAGQDTGSNGQGSASQAQSQQAQPQQAQSQQAQPQRERSQQAQSGGDRRGAQPGGFDIDEFAEAIYERAYRVGYARGQMDARMNFAAGVRQAIQQRQAAQREAERQQASRAEQARQQRLEAERLSAQQDQARQARRDGQQSARSQDASGSQPPAVPTEGIRIGRAQNSPVDDQSIVIVLPRGMNMQQFMSAVQQGQVRGQSQGGGNAQND